jgi:hypothetical protein
MFTAVATVFQQIMTQLNGAEAEEVAITKSILELMKQNDRYSPYAVNMTMLARASSNRKRQARPLSRQRGCST